VSQTPRAPRPTPRPRTPLAARVLPSRVYYGWYVALGTSLVMMGGMGIGFYGLAVFLRPLQEAHGWSNAEVSGATGAYFIISGLAAAVVGPHVDRRGPIVFMAVGLTVTGIATMLVGFVDQLWQLYVVYAVLALGFGMAGAVSINAIMARWFVRRRARAMSISSTGISVAGVILPPLGAVLIATGGLQLTTPILGVVILVFALPIVALVMVWDPAQMGLKPDGHKGPPTEDSQAKQRVSLSDAVQLRTWTMHEAVRTVSFWALAVAFVLVLMSQTGFLIHQIAFLEERMGSRTAASLALSTAAFGSIVARLVVGTFADRLDKRRLTIALFVLQGTAVLLLTYIENDVTTYVFTLTFGFTFGNVYMMQSLLVGEISGMVSFGAIFGLIAFAGQTSSGLGPLLVGVLEESTGSYTTAFTLTAILTYVAAIVVGLARPVRARGVGMGPAPPDPEVEEPLLEQARSPASSTGWSG
jgi:sugar phosphate permease